MNYIVLYHIVCCEFFNYRGTSLISRLQQSGVTSKLPDDDGWRWRRNSRSTAVSDRTHIWCKLGVTYRTARQNKDEAASSRQRLRGLPPKTANRHPLNRSPMLTLILFDCLTLFSNTNNEFYDYSSLESCSTVEEDLKWPCAKINWCRGYESIWRLGPHRKLRHSLNIFDDSRWEMHTTAREEKKRKHVRH